MYPLLMKHPNHGSTHAYDSSEVARLKGYGWAEASKDAPQEVAEVSAEPLASVAPIRRGPGRPKRK